MKKLLANGDQTLKLIVVITFILANFWVGLVGAHAQTFQKGDCLAVINVEPWDFLYIRSRPDHRSEKVAAIRYDTVNPVVVDGRCTPRTTNLRKLWCPIKYYLSANRLAEGFVKMYFTKPIECPLSYNYYQNK